MNLKEAFEMTESSTNPDYKGKTRPNNTALTHVNIKNGKPATAGDAGLSAVAKALFRTRTHYRGPRPADGGFNGRTRSASTRKGVAHGAAIHLADNPWRPRGTVKQPGKDY